MNSLMYIEELEKSIEKIKLYKKEEDLNIDSINERIGAIKYNYTSKNIDGLKTLERDLIAKLKIINKIHENNIYVLEKNKEIYQNNVEVVKTTFENLEK